MVALSRQKWRFLAQLDSLDTTTMTGGINTGGINIHQ